MENKKPVLLTGLKPSGELTIGNYIGAIKNWEKMMNNFQSYFFLADLHSITVRQDPVLLRKRSFDAIAIYISCGLDPEKCHIFVQSHVPAHAELGWILNCFTYMGEMSRMTQFKDKLKKKVDNINVGLFAYPVLMAADILLYRASAVAIGDDQKQHLEITRDIAERFNNIYGETFVVPEPYIPEQGARIMGLQNPENKMAKSEENPKDSLAMLDPPEVIRKKIMSAVTDTEGVIAYDKKRLGITNLVTIYSTLSGRSVDEIAEMYQGKGYGDFKKDLADVVLAVLEPIQKKYYEIRGDEVYLAKVLSVGAKEANMRANSFLNEVYTKIGFIPR